MRLPHALIVLFGLIAGFAAHADALWQNTEYGMTPAQVLEKYPQAFRPDQPNHLKGGATELLRLPPIELVAKKFTPRFYFKDDKLIQVTLGLTDPLDVHAAKIAYGDLAEALSAKYGTALSKDEQTGLMTRYQRTWMSGRTNITLLYLAIGKTDPVLNVIYQVRLASESDKL